MPIKCPVAPMEFLFLADDYFTKRGIRDKVELVYATPLDGAFTRPKCNSVLSYLIKQKGITIQTDFGPSPAGRSCVPAATNAVQSSQVAPSSEKRNSATPE